MSGARAELALSSTTKAGTIEAPSLPLARLGLSLSLGGFLGATVPFFRAPFSSVPTEDQLWPPRGIARIEGKRAEVEARGPKLYWFGGATTVEFMMKRTLGVFKERFGENNVEFIHSTISTEGPNSRKKYKETAQDVVGRLIDGKDSWLYFHSFGGQEGTEVLKIIKQIAPDLFDDPDSMQHLHIRYISTVGIGSIKELPERVARLRRALPIPRIGDPFEQGLASLVVPIQVPNQPRHKVAEKLEAILFDRKANGRVVVNQAPDYSFKLTDSTREVLKEIDNRLLQAISEKNKIDAIAILEERGRATLRVQQQLYTGRSQDSENWSVWKELRRISPSLGHLAIGFLSAARFLPHLTVQEVPRVAKQYKEAGADVVIYHPGFDEFLTREEVTATAAEIGVRVEELAGLDHINVIGDPYLYIYDILQFQAEEDAEQPFESHVAQAPGENTVVYLADHVGKSPGNA